MSIRKTIITAVAFFMSASVCHAAILKPADSDSESGTSVQTSSAGSAATSTASQALGALKAGDKLTFSIKEDNFPDAIDSFEVLSSFLPEGVTLEWTGKQLIAPKAGKVKYDKEEDDFVDAKNSSNPSGLKARVNKAKGTVHGSFKIYVAKKEKKVKSYSAKFSGTVGGNINVTFRSKVIAIATIQAATAQ